MHPHEPPSYLAFTFERAFGFPIHDVDLLVEFEPARKTLKTFMALASLLEEILDRRVEIVTPEALSPYIGSRILREAEDVLPAA